MDMQAVLSGKDAVQRGMAYDGGGDDVDAPVDLALPATSRLATMLG